MPFSISIAGDHIEDAATNDESHEVLKAIQDKVADLCDTLPGCTGASVNGRQVWTPTGRPDWMQER